MDKIKNVRHRRALSCFLSQMSMFTMASMSARKNLPDLSEYKGYNVMDQPGAGMFRQRGTVPVGGWRRGFQPRQVR